MSLGRDKNKLERARKRKLRVRGRIRGAAERPRLVVTRTLRSMYAQIVDDDAGKTLVGMSLQSSGLEREGDKKSQSKKLGLAIAAKARELGIEAVVLDRNRFPYHGRVRTFAEGAREGGLKF